MAGADASEQQRFLEAHPGLYHRINGRVCTRIENGRMDIGSLQCAGYGTAAEPDWTAMNEMQTRGLETSIQRRNEDG